MDVIGLDGSASIGRFNLFIRHNLEFVWIALAVQAVITILALYEVRHSGLQFSAESAYGELGKTLLQISLNLLIALPFFAVKQRFGETWSRLGSYFFRFIATLPYLPVSPPPIPVTASL